MPDPCPLARPYHDAVERIRVHREGTAALMARHKDLYDRWYSEPLSLMDPGRRAAFAPEEAAAVADVEGMNAGWPSLLDGMARARDDCMESKAASLGTTRRDRAPWVGLLVMLHDLRTWRTAELDGIDSGMERLLVERRPNWERHASARSRDKLGLFERCVLAWAKAAAVTPSDLCAAHTHVVALTGAGLLAGVDHAHPYSDDDFERLALRHGPAELLEDLERAYEDLPRPWYPVPEAAMAELRTAAPRP